PFLHALWSQTRLQHDTRHRVGEGLARHLEDAAAWALHVIEVGDERVRGCDVESAAVRLEVAWDGDPRPEGQGRFGGLVAIEGVEAAHRRDPDVDGTQGLEMCGAQPFAQISRVAERDTVDLEDLHVHGAPEAGALE